MNKKFFAALASATMAFTASGSIAVFADDFVEEKTPINEHDFLYLSCSIDWELIRISHTAIIPKRIFATNSIELFGLEVNINFWSFYKLL